MCKNCPNDETGKVVLEQKKKNKITGNMIWNRFLVSIFLVIVMSLSLRSYNVVKSPVEAEIAVRQLNDSAIDYAVSREIATRDLVNKLFLPVLFLCLLLVWRKPISITILEIARGDRE